MGLITDKLRDLLRLPGSGAGGLIQFVDSRGLFEDYIQGLSAEDLYRTQPALRTVIPFLGRNIAQLGVHTFKRVSDTDRERDRVSAVAQLLRAPNKTMTGFDLINRLVCDIGLYDDAYWIVEESADTDSGWTIQPVPPSWVARVSGGDLWAPDTVWILPPGTAKPYPVPMENVIRFHGWDPTNLSRGSSAVNALKATLMEQVHAVKYRDQMWTKAGRVGTVVTRPTADKGGANWTPEQKKAFKDVLDSKLSGNEGADAGGSIILEDGMTMDRLGFTPRENEFVEASKLNLATVAQVYHINPTMIGMLDNANFSNVREFNRSLYTNTLGPIMAMIEDRLNRFLVPRVSRETDLYVEFNIGEKLQGSFEEQAAVMQQATGRPWQTVNETRARFNMPEIEGGDALATPLNILLGGPGGDPDAPAIAAGTPDPAAGGLDADAIAKLVSAAAALIRSGFAPEAALAAVGLDPIEHLGLLPVTVQKPVDESGAVDAALQDALKAGWLAEIKAAVRDAQKAGLLGIPGTVTPLRETPGVSLPALESPGKSRTSGSKDRAPSTYEDQVAGVLKSHFVRQRKAVTAALGAKAGPDWWDGARWDRELSADLFKLAAMTATKVGRETAAALGYEPGDYDEGRTLAFLKAVAASRAESINAATLAQLEDAIAEAGEEPAAAAEKVFNVAEEQRSLAGAAALVTMLSAFGTVETGKQLGGGKALKVWHTNSADSRPEHAAMNGQSVPVDEKFSNGADWPGDPVLGADGVSGCRCSTEIVID